MARSAASFSLKTPVRRSTISRLIGLATPSVEISGRALNVCEGTFGIPVGAQMTGEAGWPAGVAVCRGVAVGVPDAVPGCDCGAGADEGASATAARCETVITKATAKAPTSTQTAFLTEACDRGRGKGNCGIAMPFSMGDRVTGLQLGRSSWGDHQDMPTKRRSAGKPTYSHRQRLRQRNFPPRANDPNWHPNAPIGTALARRPLLPTRATRRAS